MFEKGDSVVYPMHGAGIIEKIEEREILGEVRTYYILHIPFGNMQVMVPVENSEKVGLRSISSENEVRKVFELLGSESTPMDENWNRRSRENLEKLKTGDINNVAEVVRNLTRVDRVKRLSTGEKKMLSDSRKILASEIALVKDIHEDEASELIEKAV